MSGREEMLARIREALGRGKPAGPVSPGAIPDLPPPKLGGVMPPIAPEHLQTKFEAELTKVSGVPHRASSLAELEQILQGIVRASPTASVVLSRNPLLAQLGLGNRLRALGISVAEWAAAGESEREIFDTYREACFSAAAGITGADWALAETGSLVVTSQTEGTQLASLAPPIHVAVYRRSQLVESLDDVLECLPMSRHPDAAAAGRSVVFVTGVSRTADIEQILICGVHGPRELHAILIEESCLAQAPPASS